MPHKKIPIGESDFRTIIEEYYYIDKTLYIQEVIDANTSILATRPRRFGKTLNMTMLKYFYDVEEDNRYLFNGLNIEKVADGKYMEKCGKHPVIFMSFKDLKSLDWDTMYAGFVGNVLRTLSPFGKILKNKDLTGDNHLVFERLFGEKAQFADFQTILRTACKFISVHYGQKVVILIDEYDTPVIASYTNGYYADMINLMKDFLGGGFKDNPYLEKGVLTGITRIAKESLFSGLNNFEVFSITETKMSDKFGFTQDEVHQLLEDCGIYGREEEVKLWYNNYQFGKVEIYNPWSVLNFANDAGETFKTYWANTSDNALIREVMFNKEASIRKDLEQLIQGEWLKIRLEENLAFGELHTNIDAVWNLLLFAGYLSYKDIHLESFIPYCYVRVPNYELQSVFRRFIAQWVDAQLTPGEHEDMLTALLLGEVKIFSKIFQRFIAAVFSYYDTGGDMPEKFYHAFLLGLMVKLEEQYHIFSNKEIGYGRADICLVPKKDKTKLGIIIEIKAPDKKDKETLTMGIEMAEKQIIDKNYAAIMPQYGIPNYIAIAISIQGKKTMVKQVAL